MARAARAQRSDAAGARRPATGVLPSQQLRRFVAEGAIAAETEIAEEQIQPASIDLRLGRDAWRVRASFLPGKGGSVRGKIESFATHRFDLAGGAVLEKGCVYIVELMERLDLPARVSGMANPKSSTGRLDIFTRLITEASGEFDLVRAGYQGPLYAEIAPLAFSVVVRTGSRLSQLRLKRGTPALSETARRRLHQQLRQADPAARTGDPGDEVYRGGFPISVDLAGAAAGSLIGYKARNHAPLIDVDAKGAYDPVEYWEPIHARPGKGIILDPNDFYILASREPVFVPADHAAEMVAYDTHIGEFRVHYAGFFDPGFGDPETGAAGTRAVLEVRAHEVPFMVEDGQIVGRLIYEPLAAVPDKLYGRGIGSHYQRQGLRLSKHFREEI